jgi:hypothetical protein
MNEMDQTQFVFEGPFSEDGSASTQGKKKLPKVAWIAIALAAVVGVLILLIALLRGGGAAAPNITPEESPLPAERPERGVLQSKLDELRDELDLADPTRPKLVFPAVDMGVTLEKVK